MIDRCARVFSYLRASCLLGSALSLVAIPNDGFGASPPLTHENLVGSHEVARLVLGAPTSDTFVLHGTIPVPRGTFPRRDGAMPFAILDVDGTLVPAQVEIVSRYPDSEDGADVVELIARVHRPEGSTVGGRVEYSVVEAPHAAQEFDLHPAVQAALRPSAHVRLTTRDVFENEYVAELRDPKLVETQLRDGGACREWRVVSEFVPLHPIGGPHAPLPHMMGVHAIFREWAGEPVVSLDLAFHNGHSGHTSAAADHPVGTIYFEAINLLLPTGWTATQAVPDTATGDAVVSAEGSRVPIVTRLPGGKLHVFPIQAQTVRRLVLSRTQDEARALDYAADRNLAFARRGTNAQDEPLYSWWNPNTARYFPQKHVLPQLDFVAPTAIADSIEQDRAAADYALRTGLSPGYPILSTALGWAHPWGIDDGGMAGGDEIDFYQGIRTLETASNAGYQLLVMRHRMYTDRQPVALYDEGGVPSDYTKWTLHGVSGEWLPIWCFLTPLLWAADPFGFNSAPTWQVDAVAASGRAAPYEAALRAYEPIDLEHLVRYTGPAKALAWIGNDSLAKEALQLHAELFRMSYNELPNSDYGHYIPTGLANDEQYVAAHPGQGFTFGRLEAWGIDATTAWYALADPDWRRGARNWFRRVADVVEAGQSSCSGFLQAMIYEQLFGGHYRARQSIEQAITEHALVGMVNSVFDSADEPRASALRGVLRRSLRAMVTAPAWSDVHHAPWSKLAVGDASFEHLPFCGPPPPDGYADGGDGWQCWNSLAYGYEATLDPQYLQRALEMLVGPTQLLQGLQAQGLWNLDNRAALLALAQQLQGP